MDSSAPNSRRVSLEDKVAFLKQPTAYPERPRGVEAIETHMSWVFLTDTRAYKLKKPVRQRYLDFSTLAARRRNCEAEIRLNRRLAGDIYVATVPLTLDSGGSLAIGGAGVVVDWLVVMRRLPARRTLEHLIDAQAIREGEISRLVAVLVQFYAHAPADRKLRPEDYVERQRRAVEEQRDDMLDDRLGLDRDRVERLADALSVFVKRRGALFAARARQRRVLEGHGDLRPEHVYLLEDGPIVTDCLEFNRALRIVDPVDELAFLAMECERLGNAAVGQWLLADYRRLSEDEAPTELYEFHQAARAFLRAKLSIWHLDDLPPHEARNWRRKTEEYLDLAARHLPAVDTPSAS